MKFALTLIIIVLSSMMMVSSINPPILHANNGYLASRARALVKLASFSYENSKPLIGESVEIESSIKDALNALNEGRYEQAIKEAREILLTLKTNICGKIVIEEVKFDLEKHLTTLRSVLNEVSNAYPSIDEQVKELESQLSGLQLQPSEEKIQSIRKSMFELSEKSRELKVNEVINHVKEKYESIEVPQELKAISLEAKDIEVLRVKELINNREWKDFINEYLFINNYVGEKVTVSGVVVDYMPILIAENSIYKVEGNVYLNESTLFSGEFYVVGQTKLIKGESFQLSGVILSNFLDKPLIGLVVEETPQFTV